MFLANLLSTIACTVAAVGSQSCLLGFIDEPECPKSLIK